MGNTNNENRWVSMTEICEYLGISRDTAIGGGHKPPLYGQTHLC